MPFGSFLVFGFWIGTILGNVSFSTTIVARLVACRFGAFSGYVSNPTTVETSTVLSSSLIDHLSIITLQPWVGTVPSNMSRLDHRKAGMKKNETQGSK